MSPLPPQRGASVPEVIIVLASLFFIGTLVCAGIQAALVFNQNAKRLSDIDTYRTALDSYHRTQHAYPYPGSANWFCLGQYADGSCWAADGTSILENVTLDAALRTVLPTLPAGDRVGSWEGYLYRCTSAIGSACQSASIRWFMRSAHQRCGSGTVLDPDFKGLGITYCQLSLP